MFVVKCKVSLGCKPNQTRFYGRVRYTDQPCLSPSAREKACSGEGALCSLLHLKDFKSCLVRRRKKKKGLNYEITSFCLKYFTQGKKKKKAQNKRAQKEKKKNLFFVSDMLPGLGTPALQDDAGCQTPTSPAAQSPACARRLAAVLLTGSPRASHLVLTEIGVPARPEDRGCQAAPMLTPSHKRKRDRERGRGDLLTQKKPHSMRYTFSHSRQSRRATCSAFPKAETDKLFPFSTVNQLALGGATWEVGCCEIKSAA